MSSSRKPSRVYAVCAACTKPAIVWSRYCRSHQRRLRVHGHPLGRPVRFTLLLPYITQARLVLDRNKDHQGLQVTLREIEGLLDDALRRHADNELLAPDYRLWLGLAFKGVSALDILAVFCGAVAFEQLGGDPALDERAYTHRVARAVLALDKLKATTVGGTSKELAAEGLRKLGGFLLAQYSVLAIGVIRAIEVKDQKAHERRALLTAPLM